MFTTMRRRRRSATMKRELAQSVDHFKRAATLAAQETSATVGPKVNAARDRVQPAATKARDAASSGWGSAVATLTPLITAAGENVRHVGRKSEKVSKKQAKANKKNAKKLEKRAGKALGRKQTGRRGGKLFGLALAGAAVGAGTAYVARKRKAAQWDEYDPSRPIESTPTTAGAEDTAFEPADVSTTVYTDSPAAGSPAGGSTATGSTTGSTATGSTTTGSTTTASTADTVADTPVATTSGTTAASDDPLVVTDAGDQTSSAQHSPTVARMASGQNTKD